MKRIFELVFDKLRQLRIQFAEMGGLMRDYPKGGLIGKTLHAVSYVAKLRIGIHAAGACYFMVLAVFPALLLTLSLLRYTGLQVEYLTDLVAGFVPTALMPDVKRLIVSTYRNATGTMVSVSALIALWSASRGVYGVLTGLNAIYDVDEDRGWLYTRGVSMLYTFGFLIVLVLTLVLSVFGDGLLDWFPVEESPLWILLNRVVDLRFFLLLVLQTVLFTALYMVFPNRHNGVMESLPGAMLSSVGWMTFTNLFSVYVDHFPNYANIYGSIYGVALVMLWLYFCVSILFYGGVLNHYLAAKEK